MSDETDERDDGTAEQLYCRAREMLPFTVAVNVIQTLSAHTGMSTHVHTYTHTHTHTHLTTLCPGLPG